jgi:threonine dehydratase
VSYADIRTIADGIAVRIPIAQAVADLQGVVDDVLVVDDDSIVRAMRLVHEHAGLVVEPAGAAGVAAILAYPGMFAGASVATVLTGASVTRQQIRDHLLPSADTETQAARMHDHVSAPSP